MVRRWLILADDLTGAADCAIAFARRGVAAAVGWGAAASQERPAVFSYNVDSRALSGAQAAARHREALDTQLDHGRLLFKKIDSTLRGQPAAELAATLHHLNLRHGRAFGILAPAYPATGRTTVNGRVFVDDRPLEETEVWRREHTYASADLAQILAGAGIAAVPLPLSVVRGPGLVEALWAMAARDRRVAICDAESADDLQRIAKAGLDAAEAPLFVGSGGLAHALAATASGAPAAPPPLAAGRGGALIVVGSLAAVSRAAARKLAAEGRVRHVLAAPELLLGDAPLSALADEVAGLIESGVNVLVEVGIDLTPDLAFGPRLAARLAEGLSPASQRMSGFAATGGETAAILLSHFRVEGIRMVEEIEPGVALGVTLGALSVPVVTKAGAFGDEDSLSRIAQRLEAIRLKGFLS